jgi:hypothetical protein
LVKWHGNWHRAFEGYKFSLLEKFRINMASSIFSVLTRKQKYNLYESDSWEPSYKSYIDMAYTRLYNESSISNFIQKVQVFTTRLLKELIKNDKNNYEFLLLDQAVPPISISKYLSYFSYTPKVIVVDRDPRDLYIANKTEWGSRYIPTESVDQFIHWYSLTRAEHESNNNIMYIMFETLIYEYEKTLKEIYKFTGLNKSDHINKGKNFNPNLSIINTQIFKKYPELTHDILKIEIELQKYCYNFFEENIEHQIYLKKSFYIHDALFNADQVQCGNRPPFLGIRDSFLFFYFSTISGKCFLRSKKRMGSKKIKPLCACVIMFFSIPFELLIFCILIFLSRKK